MNLEKKFYNLTPRTLIVEIQSTLSIERNIFFVNIFVNIYKVGKDVYVHSLKHQEHVQLNLYKW